MTTDIVGGVWTYTLDLARGLSERGVEVALAIMACPDGGPGAARQRAAREAGVERLWFTDARLEWMDRPWDDVKRAGDWLIGLARDFSPDVVHLNQFTFGALDWPCPSVVAGHSCVVSWFESVRGDRPPPEWNRYRIKVACGLAGADVVIAPSRAMAAALERHYGPPGEVRVIPNGRDAASFRPAAKKEAFILGTGRVWDPAKNLDALDRVAPRLHWPVRIAGPISSPSCAGAPPASAEWLGELDHAALAEVMSRAAIFAAPARYEPFGLTPLEAALSGCALALGDIESLREIWGDAAAYAPPDDSDALAAVLTSFIERPVWRAEMSERALDRAAVFTIEAMTTGTLRAYAEASARFQARADTGDLLRS